MTSAEPGEGEEVRTSAQLPGGREVEGTAWFRVLADDQRIEWGAEGASAYHGYLEVRPAGAGSEVEVHLHTTRVPDGDEAVSNGIRETLTAIRQQAEAAGQA